MSHFYDDFIYLKSCAHKKFILGFEGALALNDKKKLKLK